MKLANMEVNKFSCAGFHCTHKSITYSYICNFCPLSAKISSVPLNAILFSGGSSITWCNENFFRAKMKINFVQGLH